jgi:ubiquinone/menaquinone biosynthesis C-methylase UbiE
VNTSVNIDRDTVQGFASEWSRFDQAALPDAEERTIFEQYFSIFPWESLPRDAAGFDAGCGTGRWARRVAPRVGRLHCVDASSQVIEIARRNLHGQSNADFHVASVASMPFADDSMDFGYSLGVLHHVPDTQAGIRSCVRALKKGAPFLLYLYYAFDNRPAWYRQVWRASDVVRRVVSRLPDPGRHAVADAFAASVYWPAATAASAFEKMGRDVSNWPLALYRDKSFYTMRTDALDRFGTRLEQRFTRDQIRTMMQKAGLEDIRFRDDAPYWVAVGRKA